MREHLIEWIRRHRPGALPRYRLEVGDSDPVRAPERIRRVERQRMPTPTDEDARLFGGSADGRARENAFVGPEEPAEPSR